MLGQAGALAQHPFALRDKAIVIGAVVGFEGGAHGGEYAVDTFGGGHVEYSRETGTLM
jgi:hypothetical protein